MGMTYSDEKTYGSAKYHGMKVGGVHHWTYPDGQWAERKVKPDRWEIGFSSLKRRNRKAPARSGAEVGSGYHWLIVAHQWVEKLDANTYATRMEGCKYLVAFKKPDWPVWNTQMRNSKRHARERTIAALKDMIQRIEASREDLEDAVDQAALVDLAANFQADLMERETARRTVVPDGVDGRGKARKDAMEGKEEGEEGSEEAEAGTSRGREPSEGAARRSRPARRRQARPARRRQAKVSR
jgi:hypothetical protein